MSFFTRLFLDITQILPRRRATGIEWSRRPTTPRNYI
jgi:hypothetical protein